MSKIFKNVSKKEKVAPESQKIAQGAVFFMLEKSKTYIKGLLLPKGRNF